MKQELILIESIYSESGDNFAEILKSSIDVYLKNENFSNIYRQTFDAIVEYS